MSQASFSTSPRRAPRLSPAVKLTAVAMAFVLVFVLGVAFGVRGWDVAVLGLAVLTGFIGMIPLLLDASRPPEARQILLTAISFLWVVFFAVPALTQYLWAEPTELGIFALAGHRPQDIAAAQLAALAGLICMMAGFHLPTGRFVSRRLPKLKPEWSHGTVLLVALVMIPLGWSVFLAGQFGLVPKRAGSGFLGTIAASIYYVISLLTLAFIRYRSAPAMLLLFLLIPPTMFYGFFTGGKRGVLLPLAMVALPYLVVERRLRMSFLIGGLVLIILLYPVAQFYRVVVQQGATLGAVQVLSNPGRAFSQLAGFIASYDLGEYLEVGLQASGSRINALGVATVIIRDTPSRVPYQGGWSIGYIFLAYIPRILWPGKPTISIGQWVTDTYGPGPHIRSNTGASWIGELYFNFGYPGVLIGMLILGLWFRVLQEHFFRPDATIPALLLACTVVDQAGPALGGGVAAPLTGMIFIIGVIVSIHALVQVLSPPGRRPRLAGTYAHWSHPADG